MSLIKIETYGSQVLRQKAEDVIDFDSELSQLANDMIETMKNDNGIGLAAPQVGVSRRVIIVTHGLEENEPFPKVFVNPAIVWRSEETAINDEGCLSVPEVTGAVERYIELIVRAQTLQGEVFESRISGLTATIAQHEMDHLNGILFIDRLSPVTQDSVKRKLRKKLKKAEKKKR